MAFSAEISRTNPTCLLFLVDQSKSMDGPFGGQPGKKKSEGVADAINRLLQNLVLKCAKADGVRDYFHVGVIGYGEKVRPRLAGTTKDQPLAPISTVANNPLRLEQRKRMVDDGAGGLVEQAFRFPVWFEPIAGGKTPMNEAVTLAREIVGGLHRVYPDCFPPLVINLTDGQPTDANPLDAAVALEGAEEHRRECAAVQRAPVELAGRRGLLPVRRVGPGRQVREAAVPDVEHPAAEADVRGPRRGLPDQRPGPRLRLQRATWWRSSGSWTSAPASRPRGGNRLT